MSTIASGVRHLAGVRIIKAAGGLLTHALLCSYFGIEGYGVLGIALGVLGLFKVFDLNTAAALQTFVPLLQGDGAGRQARRLTLVAYRANVAVALVSSGLLLLARGPLSGGNPVLADAFIGLAVWNLLPVLRGPVDPDLMTGLRWYRPLLLFRALEHGGGVVAAAMVWVLQGSPCTYFLLLSAVSAPTVLLSLALLPRWRRVLTGEKTSAAGSLRRFFRYCLPLTFSQGLYRVYANIGAPLIGALLSVSAAGLYKFALNIAEMAVDFLAAVPQAFHPAMAHARAAGRDRVARLYREAVDLTLALAAPAALVLMVASTWIAALLSQGKFLAAAPLLEIIAFQVFLRTVANPAVRILYVYEKTLTVTVLNAGRLALELGAFLLLMGPFGAAGAVWAHAAAAAPAAAAFFVLARRTLRTGAGGVAFALARGLALLAAFGLVLVLTDRVFGPVPGLRIGLLVVLAAYTVHRLTRRTRGSHAETLIREGLFGGIPILGRRPARPGAPITLITNSRAVGGVERHVEDLARGLHDEGIAFELVCPESPAIDSFVNRVRAAGASRVVRTGVAAPWDLAGMGRTFRDLRRTHGLLHFHLNSMDDLAPGLLLAATAGRRPILATLHLSRKDRPPLLSPKGLRRRFSLPVPDRILTVAEDLRTELIQAYGLPPDRIRTVQNGIDPDRFAFDPAVRSATRKRLNLGEDTFVFVFIGRLTRVKGVDVLLEALTRFRENPPVLLVVGTGPRETELMTRARRDHLPVRFLGWQEDVRALLAASDAFVLPSFYEGLPLVAAEAMAAGRPVVASAVCGTPEIVADGETGWLVPPGDADALFRVLHRLVEMPEAERRRMGEAGCARVRARFHTRRQVGEVIDEYARLVPGATITSAPGEPAPPDPESETEPGPREELTHHVHHVH